MSISDTRTLDANEAVASVAHRVNEVIGLYPITPSSPMGEFSDEWSTRGQTNIWGAVPLIMEMQSEAGAIGTVHGALQGGALTTTFTSSQGLLLMIPNMFKIAGELTSFCMHVAARSVATHALSIFGDHSDVMACRGTGFAMLCGGSVQEASDMACIAQAATLEARVPFLHFFDGFRTSHEVAKIHTLSDAVLRQMMDDDLIAAHRQRALTPDHPVLRGTAQNPDTFFQAREAANPYYLACPEIVQRLMVRFEELTGRQYQLFDYVGHPEAERILVLMGSSTQAADQTAQRMWEKTGEKVGVVKVRLFRPFSIKDFVRVLPATTRKIAVLDRTKEPGSVGEPLYLDVVSAIHEAASEGCLPCGKAPVVVGGRYGLSSKEFTPAMIKGVYDELKKDRPANHFTIGIHDDLTNLSLPYDPSFNVESEDIVKAVFFGLGSDGTVGANKNSIKIIGENTNNYAQGYFVYDSKKAGAVTISHLRFGPRPIRSTYLITHADFLACHQFTFIEQKHVLDIAAPGATFLLNAPYAPEAVWEHLPREAQQQIIDKKLKCYVIDANAVAKQAGMGSRINTVMQACFFALSGVLPRDEAITQIKNAIRKTYSKKGDEIVKRNFDAVDAALEHMHPMPIPDTVTAVDDIPLPVSEDAPTFVKEVTALMLAGKGDQLPVSAFPPDGTWPMGTCRFEKRNLAQAIPIWDAGICIQCNKCALVCPHAAIRIKAYEPDQLDRAPETFQSMDYKAKDLRGLKFTVQVAPEDCTGCNMCVMACPAKNKENPKRKAINMEPQREHRDVERENYDFFLSLPELERTRVQRLDVKGSQFFEPLFEFSGACAGCGETPYIKLMTQLFGDRQIIANATGCSSIYGANLPTTPYCTNQEGRGPAWSNSLFEDNAEFGLGLRLSVDAHQTYARQLLTQLAPQVGENLVDAILHADQSDEAGIIQQRQRVATLKQKLAGIRNPHVPYLQQLIDYLVKKSVWILGGDGWAYDIGYGGLDHILSLTTNLNILVMDTEVYSNTGGQASKATPLGAAAKFQAAGKAVHKKDLGLIAMSYGHVYVASIAMGAKDNHTVQALREAESYPGPSLIIAYSHCIAHGYDMAMGLTQQKRAVESGIWPLYRFDPRRVKQGKPPLQLDSQKITLSVEDYMKNETRFRVVQKMNPTRFTQLTHQVQNQATQRMHMYQQLARLTLSPENHQAAVTQN